MSISKWRPSILISNSFWDNNWIEKRESHNWGESNKWRYIERKMRVLIENKANKWREKYEQ